LQICAPVKNNRQEEIIAQTAERWNYLFEKILFRKRPAFTTPVAFFAAAETQNLCVNTHSLA
jgi:hypothetical protein